MGGWALNNAWAVPQEPVRGECPWVVSYKGINCRKTIPWGIEQPYCSHHMKTWKSLEYDTLSRVHEKAYSGIKLTPEEIRVKMAKDDEDRENDWAHEALRD